MNEKPVYRITKWDETFETSDSRRYNRLSWVSVPIGFNSNGFLSLIEEMSSQASAIYGAWIALAQIAATCPVRGMLCTSKGVGYTAGRLSVLSHFPSTDFEKLIEFALLETVGWLEVVPTDEVNRLLNGCQTGDNRLANGLRNQTEPDETLPHQTGQDPKQPVGGQVVGRVLEFSGSVDEISDEIRKFRRTSCCQPSSLPKPIAISVVVFGLAYGNGFLSDLASSLRSGSVRKPAKYCETAMRNACEENGIDWPKTKAAIQDFANEKKEESKRLEKNDED